jgi:hypothetical protein
MKDDTSDAIDFLLDHANTYNIDKDRIILYGQSRGGFITGNLLVNKKYDPSRFAGAILAMGVGVNGDKAQTASKIQVPLLIMTAENDRVVPPSGAKALAAELEKLDADVTFVLYESAGHNPRQGAGSMYEHISNFLTKFETESPPAVGSVTDEWPEMGKNLKCFDSESVEIEVIDRAACQKKADAIGHRYIQFSSGEKICATSASCDSALRFQSGWQVFWRPQVSAASSPPSSPPASTTATPLPLEPTPVATAPPTTTSEVCTTLKPTNPVWTQARCQERCGKADNCGSSQSVCANLCSVACPCGGTR